MRVEGNQSVKKERGGGQEGWEESQRKRASGNIRGHPALVPEDEEEIATLGGPLGTCPPPWFL